MLNDFLSGDNMAIECPQYGKIINLGNPGTDNAFVGEVIIQEKLDGSMMAFGVNENGELTIRSKGKIITDQCDNLFIEGWEYVKSIEEKIKRYGKDVYFYAEYMKKPKHNVLKYNGVPKNHLMLFDCINNGKFADRTTLEFIAKDLDIDVVPQLYVGLADVDLIKEILKLAESYLGGEMIEGVVIKNYSQFICLGGKTMPLFTKYVQEKFREKHCIEWKDAKPKGQLEQFMEGFKSEARIEKAYQHLRDAGCLENTLRDIPKIIVEIQRDIAEEESEYIKQHLYKCYIGDINRIAVRGVAEWLKAKLLEKTFGADNENENR